MPGSSQDRVPSDPEPHLETFRSYAKTRDARLRDQLFEAYAPFARAKARRYAHRGADPDDLEQVAYVGLLHAIERFDPERGTRFTTFAEPTILGELRRYFRDRTWAVRITRRDQELSRRAQLATERLTQRNRRRPTYQEIADELSVELDDILRAFDARRAYRSASLETLVDGAPTERRAMGRLHERLEDTPVRVALHRVLGELPEREREILRLRFEEDLTQREIGEQIGISQMHISRLLRLTMSRLRTRLTA